MPFAELDITTNFTFLTGASHPEEYVDRAALEGLQALAIAYENSVAGIVRAHARIKEIARQVNARQQDDLIGPRLPVAGWTRKPAIYESYPGGKARAKAGTLAPEETEEPGSFEAVGSDVSPGVKHRAAPDRPPGRGPHPHPRPGPALARSP